MDTWKPVRRPLHSPSERLAVVAQCMVVTGKREQPDSERAARVLKVIEKESGEAPGEGRITGTEGRQHRRKQSIRGSSHRGKKEATGFGSQATRSPLSPGPLPPGSPPGLSISKTDQLPASPV